MNVQICILALALPLIAGAQEPTGEMEPHFPQQQSADNLLTSCLSSIMSNLGRQRRNYCYGFVSGVEEGIRLTNKLGKTEIPICTPLNIRARELADSFTKYMVTHRDELDKPAAEEVYRALLQSYPCKKSG